MVDPAVDAGSEQAVLLRAASGESDAARMLLDLTGALVYGFVFARVGGRQEVAEDLVQDTYLEAVRSARSYRGEAGLGTWLCTIARRQVAGYFRTERRRARLESKLRLVEEQSDHAPSEEEAFADGEAVIAALGRLTPLHRQVLVLKYLDDLSVEEVAAELRRSAVQAQSLLQRARAGLRRVLKEASDE